MVNNFFCTQYGPPFYPAPPNMMHTWPPAQHFPDQHMVSLIITHFKIAISVNKESMSVL